MFYGYETRTGYMGMLPDEHWRLFATYDEYVEAYEEWWKSDEEEELCYEER